MTRRGHGERQWDGTGRRQQPAPGWLRWLSLAACLALLSACSSVRPWINAPLQPHQLQAMHINETRDPSLVMAVTISGGGARAAAFGYGVLRELEDHQFDWNGKRLTLLDATDLISGVSGGAIVAGYYAAFGRHGLPRFEPEFLRQDFQQSVLGQLMRPGNLHDLTSPWFGRSHLLARRLDELYQGKTFGDLERNPRHPQLVVTAMELSRGTGFEFTWDQFSLICSDLSQVPLSFAVAASSAVPVALSPLTLKNHAHSCPPDMAERLLGRTENESAGLADYRRRLYRAQAESYLNPIARPYIHLVDGGLADNLGVQRLLDRALMDGGLRQTFREVPIPPGSVRKVVLVVVNAAREPTNDIDASDTVPSVLDVAETLLFGAGARATRSTQEFLHDVIDQWRQELASGAGSSRVDAFAPDADIHVVMVNLSDAPIERRRRLLRVSTALTLPEDEVTELIRAGRDVLRYSPDFQALARDLGAWVVPSDGAPVEPLPH